MLQTDWNRSISTLEYVLAGVEEYLYEVRGGVIGVGW